MKFRYGFAGGYERNEVRCLFCGEGRVYVSCGSICVFTEDKYVDGRMELTGLI